MSDDNMHTHVRVETTTDTKQLDELNAKLTKTESILAKINRTSLKPMSESVAKTMGLDPGIFDRMERGVVASLNRTAAFKRKMARQEREEDAKAADERSLFHRDDLRMMKEKLSVISGINRQREAAERKVAAEAARSARDQARATRDAEQAEAQAFRSSLRAVHETMTVRGAMDRQRRREEAAADAAATRSATARTKAAREVARAEEQAARQSADAWARARTQITTGAGKLRSGSTRALVAGAVTTGIVGAGARRGVDSLTKAGVGIDQALTQASIHIFGTMNTVAARTASLEMRKRLMPVAVKLGTSTAELIGATVEAAQAGVDESILSQVTELGSKFAKMNGLSLPSVLEESGYALQGLKAFGPVTDKVAAQLFNHQSYLVATTAANRQQMSSFTKRGLSAGASVGMKLDETLAFGGAATAAGAEGNQASRMLSSQGGHAAMWSLKARDIRRKQRKTEEDKLFLQIPQSLGYGNFDNLARNLKTNFFETFATIQERLRTVADTLKRRAMEKELFGQEFGAITDSMVMGSNLRDFRAKLKNPEADTFLEKNWDKQTGSFGFIIDQMKSVFGNLKDSLGLALKPFYSDLRDYALESPVAFGQFEEAFKSSIHGFLTGLGSRDGSLRSLIREWLGNPADLRLNIETFKQFGRGVGEGIRTVGETIRNFLSVFSGGDASARTIGKLSAEILGFSLALATIAPVVTVIGGIATAIGGIATIAAGAAATLRAAGLMGGTAAGKAAEAGVLGRAASGLGRLVPALAMPLTLDPSKAARDKLERRLGAWAIEQERNKRALDRNTDALIQKQSYGGEGSLSGLIHKASLSSSDMATMRAGVQLAALNSGSIASAAASGSVGSVMGAAGVPYVPGGGGASLYSGKSGRSFSVPGVGARYGMGGSPVTAGPSVPMTGSGATVARGSLSQNQQEAYQAARAEGLSDKAARALVANMSGESLRNPRDHHWDRSHMSQGIVQWDPSRAAAIQRQFGKLPKDMSVAEQTKAAIWEIRNHKRFARTKAALEGDSEGTMLDALVRNYEAPQFADKAIAERSRYYRGFKPNAIGSDGKALADKAGTMLGKGILKADKDIGDGMKTSGWNKVTPGDLAKESPAEKLAREAPARSGARGSSGTTHAPITINTHGQDPETTASAVQRHITESNRYQTHDLGFESI